MVFGSLGLDILFVVLGIACLVLSAEFVVKRLINLAHHFGVSNMFIGLTVLSIGTSLPEISSHIIASVSIVTDNLSYNVGSACVLGANIGSDIIQQTFIIGFILLFMGSLNFKKSFLKKAM